MTREAWERARSSVETSKEVELYARASQRIRVSIDLSGRLRVDRGTDAGLAVRAFDARRRTLGFAAATGFDPGQAARAARRAEADAAPFDGERPWSEGAGMRNDGLESFPGLPSRDDLAAWLTGALRSSGCNPAEDPWVEASSTIETSWTREGSWTRSRLRIWGIVVSRCVASPKAEPVPRVVAARCMAALPADPWPIHGEAGRVGRMESESVVFDGEALAALVPTLVRALGDKGSSGEARVGPGWVVSDDPTHPDASVGGPWDDAGFSARPVPLADGRTVVGTIGGPGSLRRGSFRDPPEPAPSLLRVEPPAVAPSRGDVRVVASRIHSLDGRWVMEVDGVDPDGTAFHRRFVRTDPLELAARCAGGIGPAIARAGAVVTPALRFEGLRVEG
jgi:hypothetical protein